MARHHRSRLFIAGPSRLILVPIIVASLFFISACSRRPNASPPKDFESEPQFSESVGIQSDAKGPTGGASNRATEPQIPLPPGWAEQFAFDQAAAGEDRGDPNASRAGPVNSSGVDDADWAGAFDAGSSDGLDVGGQATSARSARASRRRTPQFWRQPAPPKPAPRPKGDYTVMLLVFAAPLFLLIPLAWAWHLMHVLGSRRFDGGGRPQVAEAR